MAACCANPLPHSLHLGPGLANGLANLHNARRAGSPVVNIVGEHARDHIQYDSPLTTDIEAIARPFSRWVGTCRETSDLSAIADQAIHASMSRPGGVATLILPADIAWSESSASADAPRLPEQHGGC